MKKVVLIIILLAIASSLGWFLFFNNSSLMEGAKVLSNDISIDKTKNTGTYEIYTKEAIGARKEGEKVILFFNAAWCPTCKTADKEFVEQGVPPGVKVLSIDYDTNIELRKKYDIRVQHTFVLVDSEGEPLKVWVGGGLGKLMLNL